MFFISNCDGVLHALCAGVHECRSGSSVERKALKELVELPCWKVIITLKEGNLASADRKYVMQFQHRVARDRIAINWKKNKLQGTLCMARMCHVKANRKGSRDCRSSSVLATWCMVLASFTGKEKCASLILGIGTVGRFSLLLTAFLEAGFLSTIDWTGPICCCIWGETVSCGMTVWLEKAPLQRVDGQEQGVTSEEGNVSSLHMLRIRVSTFPQSHLQKFPFLRCFHLLQLCQFSHLWGWNLHQS